MPRTTTAARKTTHVPSSAFVVDSAAVFEGIPAVPHEDAIHAAVTAALVPAAADPIPIPSPGDGENEVVHPIVHRIVGCIRVAAEAQSVPCRKLFHGYEASTPNRRAGSLSGRTSLPRRLRAYEHQQDPSNHWHDIYIAVKAVATVRATGRSASSADMLIREGVVQAMRRILNRRCKLNAGTELRHGLAVVTNSLNIAVVRINFAPGALHQYRVLLTGKDLSVRGGDGLRFLIRLLCQPVDERVAYGWPPNLGPQAPRLSAHPAVPARAGQWRLRGRVLRPP